MKRTLLFLAAVASATSLQALTILQGSSDDYVKFAAGSFDSLINTATSTITDNVDGTLTTATRDDSDAATLTYMINFASTGNYTLYFDLSAAGLSNDSIYVATSPGTTPTTTDTYRWNNLSQVGGGTNSGWAALASSAGTGVAAVGTTEYSSPAPLNVASTGTDSLIFRPREEGLVWENFVLSTNANLSATELDNLTYSSTIPEPSTYAGIAGLLVLGLALWRGRNS